MRKFVLVAFVAFTASVFAVSTMAQRRSRRGRASVAVAVQTEPPSSPRIAQELGGLRWGMNHDEVVAYFRQEITSRYQPLLRNKGQVEQDRLMQERDREIEQLRTSYVQFNGAPNQRRWDTSFVGDEYTHNNNESMLVREDPQTGNREFFFFFNDRLWKRFQARAIPATNRMDFATFLTGLEQLFGPGLRRTRPGAPDQIEAELWQDENTRLRVIDQSTFYNAFCLIYEDRATLARLAELRRNAPVKTSAAVAVRPAADEPQVGNVEGDPNADIVDRITGKMRHTQQAQPAAGASGAAGASAGTSAGARTPAAASAPVPAGDSNDPLRGL